MPVGIAVAEMCVPVSATCRGIDRGSSHQHGLVTPAANSSCHKCAAVCSPYDPTPPAVVSAFQLAACLPPVCEHHCCLQPPLAPCCCGTAQSKSLAPQAQHTCTVSVTSCTTLTATLSRRRASYLTSMWLLSTLPSVLLVTSTWERPPSTAWTQHTRASQWPGVERGHPSLTAQVARPGGLLRSRQLRQLCFALRGVLCPLAAAPAHTAAAARRLLPGQMLGGTDAPPVCPAHLHAHKLGHLAVRCLDGCHGQQVPEGCAVLAVVEQPAAQDMPQDTSDTQMPQRQCMLRLILQQSTWAVLPLHSPLPCMAHKRTSPGDCKHVGATSA